MSFTNGVFDSTLSKVSKGNLTVSYSPAPEPVDDLVSLTYGGVRYDRRTGQMSVDVVITNISAVTISNPLKLVLEEISFPGIGLANTDGQTSEGKDYVDLVDQTDDGSLDPGEGTMVPDFPYSG